MPGSSCIAGATRALHTHLLRAYARDWDASAPRLLDSTALLGTSGGGDRLLVTLYAIGEDAAARNAAVARPGGDPRHVRALVFELHYLVAAHAPAEDRAQALLERAWMHLHATPVIPASGEAGDLPLPAVVHGLSVDEALPLFRALGMPLRPAFGCRLRVSAEA